MSEKAAIIRRLRRVEGQIKGIQKMVEEEKFCGDILIQIAAARSALNNAGGLILENYMKTCLKNYTAGCSNDEELDKLVEILLKYSKQN
ncbi:metal-sensitive transcriptional regulator [Wansuia hejianensis]|uniref:Metal-sensitive transcriptional regulator n=1 Tax=Wansuia hejianensis TaxID=2763667 RepID=A0A926IH98_9FIRM|nr:metal-sensitive transcriptional regulator [Wansuia hejianensis]MBC8590427.1 metal-sensitive transcriptional regulator [Wansuia hejianensis]